MIGLILAAGAGRRLGSHTAKLPKTLLPVMRERTILDMCIGNLARVGIEEVVVVVGYAAEAVVAVIPALEVRHGLKIRSVFNDRWSDLNNAFSLWRGLQNICEDVLLVNGDTVHPDDVERILMSCISDAGVVLAVDRLKALGDEEMKVNIRADGSVFAISKGLVGASAEYIGVARILGSALPRVLASLELTWMRDGNLYYEDGFQEFIDSEGRVVAESVGQISWVEVDNSLDLALARVIACRY